MKYYRNLYRLETRDYMMALELDDGTVVECITESDVLKCCVNTAATASININGITFIKNQVVSVYFGNLWNLNNIPNYFCHNFTIVTQIDPLPNLITSIGNSFMQDCTSFNQPLTLPNSITSIGDVFMYKCTSFNQPIILPNSLTSIGTFFMGDCTSFNLLITLPSSLRSTVDCFMYNCNNFTGPLEILFTNPNLFINTINSLSTISKIAPMYTTGVTITGNMTGAQLRTRLPNITSGPFRKILD